MSKPKDYNNISSYIEELKKISKINTVKGCCSFLKGMKIAMIYTNSVWNLILDKLRIILDR